MSIETQLAKHLGTFDAAPFLFVGSGLSRRYIGLETWKDLLQRFSVGLPQPYEYYFASAKGDLALTATKLVEDFHELWWKDAKYHTSREAFKSFAVSKSSALKYEIAQYVAGKVHIPDMDRKVDEEIEVLKKATIDGIITTNWDTALESIFPEFEVYVGQEEVLFAKSQGIAEIYKIHGSVAEPNSLVLTAEDYENFDRRNPYLAAKLLTTFVEHPVIFLGYSLSDANIRKILIQIALCLTNDNIEQLRDRLLFVERDRAGKGDSFESSVLQLEGYTLPVTIIRTNDFLQIYRPLKNLRRRFSARLLRKMKEHVYELVRSNDPKEKLAVIDIEEADRFDELEVVYGVGVNRKLGQVGYKPLSRVELLKDVLSPESQYNPRRIVEETLPHLLRGGTKYVPIFRYLREGGYIGDDGRIDESRLTERIAKAADVGHEHFYPPTQYHGERGHVQDVLQGVNPVILHYPSNAFYYIPLLRTDQIDVGDLRKYLLANLYLMTSKKASGNHTYFRSLICLYDWLKYRNSI